MTGLVVSDRKSVENIKLFFEKFQIIDRYYSVGNRSIELLFPIFYSRNAFYSPECFLFPKKGVLCQIPKA